MNRWRLLLVTAAFIALFAVPVLAQVSPHFDLSWSLLSGGGGARGSGVHQLDGLLGQWPDGRSRSAQYQIDPGFWPAGRDLEEWQETGLLYVPVIYGG
ncbi:MAG: hypothetical protein ACK2UK_21230 [Candidatus Promineifilaceae bacterium]